MQDTSITLYRVKEYNDEEGQTWQHESRLRSVPIGLDDVSRHPRVGETVPV